VAVCGLIFLAWTIATGQPNLGVKIETFLGGFPRLIFLFFGGAALQKLHARGQFRFRVPTWLLVIVVLATLYPNALPYDEAYRLVVVCIVYPVVVLLAANASPARGIQRKVMAFSGDISFPLYIVHWPLFLWAMSAYSALHVDYHAQTRLYGGISAVGAVTIAWLAFKLYDVPVRRWLTGLRLPAAKRRSRNGVASA